MNITTDPTLKHPLIINEVSNKGTEGARGGEDWIELCNNRSEVFDLDSNDTKKVSNHHPHHPKAALQVLNSKKKKS